MNSLSNKPRNRKGSKGCVCVFERERELLIIILIYYLDLLVCQPGDSLTMFTVSATLTYQFQFSDQYTDHFMWFSLLNDNREEFWSQFPKPRGIQFTFLIMINKWLKNNHSMHCFNKCHVNSSWNWAFWRAALSGPPLKIEWTLEEKELLL